MKCSKKVLIFLLSFTLCVGFSYSSKHNNQKPVQVKAAGIRIGKYPQSREIKNWTKSHGTKRQNKVDSAVMHKFTLGNYSYFLTTEQKTATPGSPYISKIKRACYTPGKSIADEYSEILIECTSTNATYNLVQAAHVGKPGLNLMRSLNITSEDEVLFATFSKNKTNNSDETTADSAMCIYSLDTINKKFTEKIRNCFNNETRLKFESILVETKCVETISTVDIDTKCIRGVKNVPFDGNESIISSPLSTFTAHPTDIISARKENRTIILIGTSDGYLKIFIVNGTESPSYEYGDSKLEENFPVKFNSQRSTDELLVFYRATNISGIINIKLLEIPCRIFSTYDSCLQSDIKRCGWCGFSNLCTRKLECEQIANKCTSKDGCLKTTDLSWIKHKIQQFVSIHVDQTNFSISMLNHKYLPSGRSRALELSVHVPNFEISKDEFYCKITFESFNLSFITNASVSKTTHTNYTVTCETPILYENLTIPSFNNSITANLTIELANDPGICNIPILFFNCTSYNSHKACASSHFECQWCPNEGICTFNATNPCKTNTNICLNSSPPSISSIKPVQGPWEGGTNLTILVDNLGCTFEDILQGIIKVASIPCTPLTEKYVPMKKIVCNINRSNSYHNFEGPVELQLNKSLLRSHQNFKFVTTKISDISPKEGFSYGGTELTIKGEHLDAGRFVEISIGNASCPLIYRYSNEMKCITSPSMAEESEIIVKFDNNICKVNNSSFKYIKDPKRDENGFNIAPKGILSGGVEILIRYIKFTGESSTPKLQFVVHFNKHYYNSSCTVQNDSTATCLSPRIPDIGHVHTAFSAQNPLELEYSLKHQPANVRLIFRTYNNSMKFTLYPDPEFFYFLNSSVEFDENTYAIIKGQNINSACQKSDIKVKVGNNTCTVISLKHNEVICSLRKSQSVDFDKNLNEEYDILAEHENITVLIGDHFKRIVHKQQNNPTVKNTEIVPNTILFCIIAILCAMISFLFIYLLYYRSYFVKNSQLLVEVQQRMNKVCLESIALRQHIKQIIIENQIKLDEDSSNILKLPNISIVDIEDARIIDETSSDTQYLLPIDEKWEFPRDNLSLGRSLGEGEFGKVVQAEALGIVQTTVVTTVAVKMLKDVHSDEDMIDLVSEMEIMKLIGAHVNVLKLLGCCTKNGKLLIITEFASHGNLRDFLRNHLPSAKNELKLTNLTQKTLLMFAQQVAKGMEYLASKKCVHRDLAARNVLVSNYYIMKIADFGLARNIRSKDYYQKETKGRLPVKWMAPEALAHGLYSIQSDVWSFGILLWEILTFGATPYPSFPDLGKLYEALQSGYRMEKPPNCSVKLYSLMRKCWSYMPEERPSFTIIADALEDLSSKNVDDEVLQRRNVY